MLSKIKNTPVEFTDFFKSLTLNEIALVECILNKKIKNKNDVRFFISQEDFINLGFHEDDAVDAIKASCDAILNRIISIGLRVYDIEVATLEFHFIDTVFYLNKAFQKTVRENPNFLPAKVQNVVEQYKLSTAVTHIKNSNENIVAYIELNSNVLAYLDSYILNKKTIEQKA